MRRKNQPVSLSRSYFRLSAVLLVVAILATGIVMVTTAVATYTDTVKRAMLQNCETLAANLSEIHNVGLPLGGEDAKRLIRTAEQAYQYRVWVYSDDSTELYPADGGSFRLLTPQVRAFLNTGEYMELGYYTDDAQSPQLCCVIRSYSEGPQRQVEMFYLAALCDAANVQEYSNMLIRALVVCLLAAVLLFMLLFRFSTLRLDSDFEAISEVTAQYAEGDFSARVELPEHAALYPYAVTLDRMAGFIEQNETTRRNFIANVSHELRTPMTTIGGFADGILDGTIPPEQHRRYIKIIAEEIHRLRTLVNSMLNLTKFEAGEMQLRLGNVDVAALLIKTVLMFEKRISDKNVEVEGLEDLQLTVRADEDLLSQVLYNLIENAVKFVNEGGVISFATRVENGTACITVKNTGEGLADDELPKIFDRFYKTDTSRSKDKTGLGLGLSIARKIVHLHSGHIVVKSVKGEYTAFEIQIPANGK